jgi:hypothetical protein
VSQLQTYGRRVDASYMSRWPLYHITEGGHVKREQGLLVPGDLVCHENIISNRANGRGLVVAITDDEVVVLWALEPNTNPMAYEEDFYIPVAAVHVTLVPAK